MITENLFEEILMKPARESADELYIVSGYANALFASNHLENIISLKKRPFIRLIIGMFPQIGNLTYNHLTFKALSTTDFPGSFECRYNIQSPPVHVKAYCWYKNSAPYRGFLGSANYSKNAFEAKQREAMTDCDPSAIKDYFDVMWDKAIDCREPDADRRVDEAVLAFQHRVQSPIIHPGVSIGVCDGLENHTLSLLASDGDIHNIAGLNWGQRQGREPNQAYIPIPAKIGSSGFLPPLKQQFTMLMDDGITLICVSAQPKKRGGAVPHAIQTTLNNSDLGLYFRNRLGLPSGAFVTKQDLIDYGRTDVTICKIDEETYYLDFSV